MLPRGLRHISGSSAKVSAARRLFRAGSYSVVQGLSRSKIKSLSSIPAIVPWVSPAPESPVAMYTLSSSPGFLPMNANPSTLCMTCPDHRNSGSFYSGEMLAPPSCEAREAVLSSAFSSCTAEVWIHLHSPRLQQPFRGT
jgi:hypothetical protein